MAGEPTKIKIDEAFIANVRDELVKVRNQISLVRGGRDATTGGGAPGMPLNNIRLLAGAEGFTSGGDVKVKVVAVAGQVDAKLQDYDKRLDKYAQVLQHILDSADNVELTNMSLAEYNRITGAGTGPGGGPPGLTP